MWNFADNHAFAFCIIVIVICIALCEIAESFRGK